MTLATAYAPGRSSYFDRFASAGCDPALLRTIEAYFSEGLGIDADDQRSLHTILVK